MKVQKSASQYVEAAYDEVEILDQVSSFWKKKEWQDSLLHYYKDDPDKLKELENSSKYWHTVQLLNSFMHQGPNGHHFVMVFEILGVNLLEIIKRYDYKGIPIPLVRELTKQCLVGLDYLHRIWNLIHTDLKPENVVIYLTKEELSKIKGEGMLKSSKMNEDNAKLVKKLIAWANGVPVKESPTFTEKPETDINNCQSEKYTETENIATEKSNCDTALTKKRQRKNKQKKVKKYIKQGKLPKNYHDLSKEEKDKLYNAVRAEIEKQNMEKEIAKISNSATPSMTRATQEESKPLNSEIDIELSDINIDQLNTDRRVIDKIDMKQQVEKSDVNKPDIPQLNINKAEKPQTYYNYGKEANKDGSNSLNLDPSQNDMNMPTKRGPKLGEDAILTIVDMGNGCWTHHHYTTEIQTRQYRSPETIIGVPYGTSADIWSLGCMVFELLTGDFAFEPKQSPNYSKDDDHLAQMIELLGPMPKNFALSGSHSKRYFDSTGHLRKIRGLNYWPLIRVLVEKYRFKRSEAEPWADFLMQTFTWDPEKRATAQQLLEHPWLKMEKNYDYKIPVDEFEVMLANIRQKEEAEKRKKELEIILKEGSLPPEEMAKRLNSENNSQLVEDDFELFAADVESYDENSVLPQSEKSISLGDGDSDQEIFDLFEGGGYGKGKALNNSFSGPYNNMENVHKDKGHNNQFDNIE